MASSSLQASNKATAGTSEVNRSVQQIYTVREISQYASDLVDKLGERSNEIGAIVDTISDLLVRPTCWLSTQLSRLPGLVSRAVDLPLLLRKLENWPSSPGMLLSRLPS